MADTSSSADRLVKHSSIYAIGTLSRQLIGFLLLPLYTNYLTPADYGAIGLLVFTLALIEPLFGARLGEALPKFYFEQAENRGVVVTTALAVTGGISAVVACGVFLLREPVAQLLFGPGDFSLLVGLFGFQLITQAIEYYGLTFLRLEQRPMAFLYVTTAKLVLQIALNVWLVVYAEMGALGVIISGLVSTSLFAAGLVAYVLKRSGFGFDGALAKRMLSFNMPLWFSGLAALYIFSANRYYIRVFDDLSSVGLYELAARFAGVLPLLVWSPFSQFWEIERFAIYKSATNREAQFAAVFRFISLALVLVALGLGLFSGLAIQLMSAPEFHAAGSIVPWLSLAMLFSSLSNFCGFSLLVTSRTGIINRNSYLTVLIISALNVMLIPSLGASGAAMALMLSLAIQFFIINAQAKKYFDMQIALVPLFAMIGIAAVGMFAAEMTQPDSLWLAVANRTAIYLVCGAAIVWLQFRNPAGRAYTMQIVRSLTPAWIARR